MKHDRWSEGRANAEYGMRKREYTEACMAFAEAMLEHRDLAHPEVVEKEAACRAALVLKQDSWRVWNEVMFK